MVKYTLSGKKLHLDGEKLALATIPLDIPQFVWFALPTGNICGRRQTVCNGASDPQLILFQSLDHTQLKEQCLHILFLVVPPASLDLNTAWTQGFVPADSSRS